MSGQLDRASQHLEAGKDRKALESLWPVEAQARTGEAEAQGLLTLASAIRDRNRGRLAKEASELVELAQRHLERLADPATSGVMLRVPFSRVVVSEGFEAQPGEVWDLVFTGQAVFLRGPGALRLEYDTITSIDVERLPQPADRGAKVRRGTAAIAKFALNAVNFGFLNVPDLTILGITLRTASGLLVLSQRSEVTLEQWETQLAPVVQKVTLARRDKDALSEIRDRGER